MQSKTTTVKEYLAELPSDRRAAISAVRDVILKNLDKGYDEGMQYGGIGYYVPHKNYPPGYHCDPKIALPFAGLASQKNHMAVYMMCMYGENEQESWFRKEWAKTGKKLDMGKCCIRFRKLENLPLELIGEAIRRMPAKKWIAYYEKSLEMMRNRTTKGPPGGRKTAKKPGAGSARSVPKKK
jgi:hypothetical protein